MNPPFGQERDLRHIMIAYNLLAPGGTLVALAAKNCLYYDRHTTHSVNLFLESHGAIIEDVPYGTFKESNTNVDVSLIRMRKI